MVRRTRVMALAVTALVAGVGAAAPAASSPAKATASPALGPTPTPTASPARSDGTLQILTYRGYADYAGTTAEFEKITGCRIARFDTVQTADEMKDRAAERPYDVISAGPALAAALVESGQVRPIDTAEVTGYTDLSKRFRDMSVRSGKVYGVPYLWGSHEFLYDSSRVKDGDDLRRVFDSDDVALQDSPLTIADAALADKDVDDPYELTEEQLDRAVELLDEHGERSYWSNPLDLVKGFATGKLDYAQATPYYRLLLERAGKPVKAVTLRRTTGWVDSWMLGAGVPDTECAYRWLGYTTSATVQRRAAAWVGLAPANPKACVRGAKRVCDAYGVGKDSRLERIAFAVRPPGGCAAGKCAGYPAWTDRWRELVK
ncbi:putative spermidine/putrescine transport system substrate-binding protein [Nonomuraea muscovyensis]|uniref:Putative spermidine/putrescine transport system substrate-binding protein n=1 Tax=Nonomuraea muscovyensis TaxID=1124761 RepID=A0A7X0BZP9_9ACTN|nr:extracellular solute-binding protein [Nonomuraea muscovyensis]MBB6344805.1 putative spermidine/putrescine transport system substrate-binding protein [Nonomuraea muscovyensis]